MPGLDPESVKKALILHRQAVERRELLLEKFQVPFVRVFYEDLFLSHVPKERQLDLVNAIVEFIGVPPFAQEIFAAQCGEHLSADLYRWSSEQVYRSIPNIIEIEREVASCDNGKIFDSILEHPF